MTVLLKKKAIAFLLIAAMLFGLTACGSDDEDKGKKRDNKYKDVSAYDLAMEAVQSQDSFADGAIEKFDLQTDNCDTYFELCYDVEDFSESNIAEDFSYIGCSVGNADEVAVAVVPKKSNREKVEEMFRFRMDSRIETFTGYAPEQVQKLKKGKILSYDQYLIFLVCDDVDTAEEAIVSMLKTGKSAEKNPGKATVTPTAEPTEDPTPIPTVEPTSPTPEPTPIPTPTEDPVDPDTVYYRGKFNESFNPILPEAIRTGNREMLTDTQDLKLYDYCRNVLIKLFDGKTMTEYEAEKAIYRYVGEHIDYDYGHYSLEGQKLNSDNPYGAFFTGVGICTGYSSAFRLLCLSVGIECIEVDGSAYREHEAHGWNMVKLGPYWYYADPCWGRRGDGTVGYYYFDVTEKLMLETEHHWEASDYPEADTMSYAERKKAGYPADLTGDFRNPEEPRIWFTK